MELQHNTTSDIGPLGSLIPKCMEQDILVDISRSSSIMTIILEYASHSLL